MEKVNAGREPSSSDLHNMQGFSRKLSENKDHRIYCATHSQSGTVYQKLIVVYWKMWKWSFKKVCQDSRYHNCIGKSDVFLNECVSEQTDGIQVLALQLAQLQLVGFLLVFI